MTAISRQRRGAGGGDAHPGSAAARPQGEGAREKALLQTWLAELASPARRQLWADIEDDFLHPEECPEEAPSPPAGAAAEGRDLESRRRLGPRGGRKPKFPPAGCLPAGSSSCRQVTARGRHSTAADAAASGPRAACGSGRTAQAPGGGQAISSKPASNGRWRPTTQQ
mmetsp:Transcript_90316/g.281160  ORF Transcript_90316/g.281160 Transcript_90316/m.281160 type:complete len:168 (-) Transcript_90316:12-515(-)